MTKHKELKEGYKLYEKYDVQVRKNFMPINEVTVEIKTLAKMIGYRELPVDIVTFVKDKYFLGGSVDLFPFWLDKLTDIFPTPIHTKYPMISLSCAIGSGKSTVSKIIALYSMHRLNCLDKVGFLGVGSILTKPLEYSFFHVTTEKANLEFIYSIRGMQDLSPYFKTTPIRHGQKLGVDGARSNNAIGKDIIFFNLSELNFINYNIAYNKINSAVGRFKARFQNCYGYFGNIILDSSPSSTSSVVNDYIKLNAEAGIYTVNAAIWEAKAHYGSYFREGEFFVYLGDSNYDPFIIEDMDNLPDTIDKERILRAPKEHLIDFRSNIIKAIQDLAGISTGSNGTFIKNKDKIRECMTLPKLNQEIISMDFYDANARLMDYLGSAVSTIPKEKIIYVRIDLGITNDKTGLCIGYFDDYVFPNPLNPLYKEPTYLVPVCCAISRPPGQETSITKIKEFLMELNDIFEIGGVSTDQFQSTQLRQDLKVVGIKSALISVDRTDEAYTYLKNLMYRNGINMMNHDLLQEELLNLQYVDGKVDHPKDKSKDIADALSGLALHIFRELGYSDQISSKVSNHRSIELLSGLNKYKNTKNHSQIKNSIVNGMFR